MKKSYTKKELTELFAAGDIKGLEKAMDYLETTKGYSDPLTVYAVELLSQLDDEADMMDSYEEEGDHLPQIYTEESHLPKNCWGKLV